MDLSDLYQLGRRLTDLAGRGMEAAELDIPPSEFVVLRDVFMNGRSSISETVERTGLAQSRVSTCVADLRRRGWVATSVDPGDARRTLVEVTPEVRTEGDRRRAMSAADALASSLRQGSPQEREQLVSALARLHELLVASEAEQAVAPTNRRAARD